MIWNEDYFVIPVMKHTKECERYLKIVVERGWSKLLLLRQKGSFVCIGLIIVLYGESRASVHTQDVARERGHIS